MRQLKQGYKQTDIGVIPEDWEVVKLGKISTNMGYGVGASAIIYDGINKYIRITDIDDETHSFIPSPISSPSFFTESYLANEGDILFARTGASVGKSYIYDKKDGKLIIAGFLIRLNILDALPKYVYFQTLAKRYKEWVLSESARTGQPGLNLEQYKSFEIPIPKNTDEQTAIATALSDIDALISALDKKITKKQRIKQGTMQQLLTGKKRLPGFSGEWENVVLSDIVDDFIVPMRDKPKNLKGNIPWCRIEDFNGMYLWGSQSEQGVDIETVKSMNLKIYPIGTLLVSCSAYLGRCAIVGKELVTNQTFIGLFPSKKCNVEFLYYAMKREEKSLNSLSSGTTISYLSREQFESYPLFIPSKSEQTAIAQVLTDMDNEIEKLQAERDKYKQLKAGMMQQLLTGKIRLVN